MGALQLRAQGKVHVLVEGIQLVRTVQRQAQHAVLHHCENSVGLDHECLPSTLLKQRPTKFLHRPTGRSIIKA